MNAENLSGQRIGPYKLREVLGAGGMAVVYRAYQTTLKREVAIKILTPNIAYQPGYLERFNREAETSARLQHPHIVPIIDHGTQRGISYLVMNLLPGGTLAQRIEQRNPGHQGGPSLSETARMISQLAGALDYAHRMNVIHRDIKPSNVMFDNEGNAYLGDFGIAKLIDATSGLTNSGTAFGTPAYMAPEQWLNLPLTSATDQYALAILVYVLLSGQVPFVAEHPYAVGTKHVNEVAPDLHLLHPEIPVAVSDVIKKAMAKQPEDRYPTPIDFANAFEKVARTEGDQESAPTGFFTYSVRNESYGDYQPQADGSTSLRLRLQTALRSRSVTTSGLLMLVILISLGAAALILVPRLFGPNGLPAEPTNTATRQIAQVPTELETTVTDATNLPAPSSAPPIGVPSTQAATIPASTPRTPLTTEILPTPTIIKANTLTPPPVATNTDVLVPSAAAPTATPIPATLIPMTATPFTPTQTVVRPTATQEQLTSPTKPFTATFTQVPTTVTPNPALGFENASLFQTSDNVLEILMPKGWTSLTTTNSGRTIYSFSYTSNATIQNEVMLQIVIDQASVLYASFLNLDTSPATPEAALNDLKRNNAQDRNFSFGTVTSAKVGGVNGYGLIFNQVVPGGASVRREVRIAQLSLGRVVVAVLQSTSALWDQAGPLLVGMTESMTLNVTPTETPTDLPTATFTVPPTWTPTSAPTATPFPTAQKCQQQVLDPFKGVWPQYTVRLGCPTRSVNTSNNSYQDFQGGILLWRGVELDGISAGLAILKNGSWQRIHSNASSPQSCSELQTSRYAVPSSFRKLLCTNTGFASALGAAAGANHGYTTSFVTLCENGFLLHYNRAGDKWFTIVFFYGDGQESGTWVSP